MKGALILDRGELDELPGATDHDKLSKIISMERQGAIAFIGILEENMMVKVMKSNHTKATHVHYEDIFKLMGA